MKDVLLREAGQVFDVVTRTNIARQYLQRQVLASLAGSGAFRSIAFIGGTCLRFLHDLKRYSEDMDFSLESAAEYEPQRWMNSVRASLASQGFAVVATWRKRRAVDHGWIKIAGILHDLGAAAVESQLLSIKVEIDTNPPAAAQCETTALQVPRLIAVRHYDLRSLMAGKLNAVLSRPYAKGRDWYDLLWYLVRKVDPNLDMLQNGLEQVSSSFCEDARQWQRGVLSRLDSLDWPMVVEDVRPFLEDPSELSAFTPEVVRAMLRRRG